MGRKYEQRNFAVKELRVSGDSAAPVISGYASVFNQPSEDLGGFREVVKPGCFAKTIQESDIRALVNHDPNQVLGRTKNGTLTLSEDNTGLAIRIMPPDTQCARDVMTLIKRGDIDQMSFGFKTIKDNWTKDGGMNMRELMEAQLFDVSAVTYPAYTQTSVNVRKILDSLSDEVKPPEPAETDHSEDEPVKIDHSAMAKRLMVIELENKL